ncbi:MAG: glutamine-hydrolyzing carbamoyl-phosphate synthase small subunit [Candidatus Bipolaricaulota bacterium]
MKKGLLALEDGTVIEGKGLGADGVSLGELVFNTSFTGYEESLTDPSYKGQNLMFTYPLIGNYGIQEKSRQSDSVKAEGIVAREINPLPDHMESEGTVSEFLEVNGSRGIVGVDTRDLTLKIRKKGTVKSAIAVGEFEQREVASLAKNQPPITEKELIPEVSSDQGRFLGENGLRMAVIDTGVKRNILRNLVNRGFEVALLPHDTDPEEVESYDPDGIFFTNGPGDPAKARIPELVAKSFYGRLPLFGICFGAQIISRALGGETYKLKFGHRGANQPVKDHRSGVVNITSQNHGFAIDGESLKSTGLEVTETNSIDGTVEAIEDEDDGVFAVQYHPEASPGPKDTEETFFDRVEEIMGGSFA